jgi:hypothetical protein
LLQHGNVVLFFCRAVIGWVARRRRARRTLALLLLGVEPLVLCDPGNAGDLLVCYRVALLLLGEERDLVGRRNRDFAVAHRFLQFRYAAVDHNAGAPHAALANIERLCRFGLGRQTGKIAGSAMSLAQRRNLGGGKGALARVEVAPLDVFIEDIVGGIEPGGQRFKARLDAGRLASSEPIATIEDHTVISDDRLAEPVRLDRNNKLVELFSVSAAKLDGKNRRFYLCDQMEDFFGLPRRRAKAARYAASNMACVRLFPNLWRAYS